MDIGADVEVRIAPEAPPVEVIDGRYWLHDDALYAEIDRANKRFYLVEDVNVEAFAYHVKRVLSYRASVPTSVTMKWCSECPYGPEDELWTGWQAHSAALRFQNFLQRRSASRGQAEAASAAALRARLEKERSENEARRRQEESEAFAANCRHQQSAKRECLTNLARSIGLPDSEKVRPERLIEWIKTLPIPDDVHEHGHVLDERQRAILIASSNSVRLKDLGAVFDVAAARVGQLRNKAFEKIETEKRRLSAVKQAVVPRGVMRVPNLVEARTPRLQMHTGPLMEWTAEMQAAEIAAERG